MTLPVADPWFVVEDVGDGVTMLTEPHVARLWRANVFLIRGRDRDLVFDTGMGVGDLRGTVAALSDRPLALFTSHSHLDHIGGHPAFADVEIMLHPAEVDALRTPEGPVGLSYASLPERRLAEYRAAGFATDGLMVDAVPSASFDVAAHHFAGAEPTRLVGEGDVVDLGDRAFEVLHLPGHSPGSVALWERATGVLVAGDVIYDGILIDTTADAHIPTYLRTMERVREIPVRVVHAGHRGAFGRERMVEIADAYVASRAKGVAPVPKAAVSF